ncbi:MAG: glycosyltransferase family 39 protein, partial [Verrucomicrobia bacterium]|nr:glycosyltransferase family 39 protein [Verrucomicrobiota bacterium]
MLEAMKHTPRVLDFLIPVCFAASLVWCAPLATAFQFGGDEGYELMKGFLSSQGYPLYQSIWNDQPPLHTAILAALFRWFGPSAFVGRLLAVGFATLLVAVFYQLVRERLGRTAALLAVLVLVSSPSFLQLSVSVMIELPAMALGLGGALALLRYFKQERIFWPIVSGIILGCALQTKLTAAIFFPALLVEWTVQALSVASVTVCDARGGGRLVFAANNR